MSLDNPLVFVGLFFGIVALVGFVFTIPPATRGWGTLVLYGGTAAFTVWLIAALFILILG